MSVTRPFVWVCDPCGRVEHVHGYGLPKGWAWYGGTVQEKEIKHKCSGCVEIEKLKAENAQLREQAKKDKP